MHYAIFESPAGLLLIAGDDHGIRQIRFRKGSDFAVPPDWTRDDAALTDVTTQLREYFEGRRRAFDLRLDPEGTAFQRSVWTALESIPYGETVSYLDIANRLGKPAAVRAVGAANGANPIPIVIPCHRVIGADGSLTGYGGGIDVKKWLLNHERGERGTQMGLFSDRR